MLLGAAALLTFAGAALSALAVSSEPTMRAEDSSWETTSKAVLVRRQLARSTTRPVAVDAGATSSEIYIDRSRELERSL